MYSDINVEILEKSKQHVKFVLSNCDLAFANALRRIMISEIPTMAIELVSIYNNTSVLSDNLLAHRLGLIPLISTDVSNYKYTHDCACKAEDKCPSCRAFFRLYARCDGDALEITTKNLEPMDPECSVKPVQYNSIHGEEVGILIAKMRKNQEIELECEARKGIGKFHAKWSPVSVANFVHEAVIKLDDRIDDWDDGKKENFVATCPTRVYTLTEKSKKILVERSQDCMFCNECVNKAESFGEADTPNYIKITRRKDRFIFSVETTGVLTPDEIVKSALRVLSEKLKTILDNIPTDTR